MNTGIEQLLGILSSKGLGVSDGSTVTNGGIEVVIQLADLALALHSAQNVHRQDAVGVSVGIDGVIAAVSGLVGLRGQIVHTGDIVLTVVGSGGGLNVVGVALGDNTAGGAQGDGRLGQILDGGVGGHGRRKAWDTQW